MATDYGSDISCGAGGLRTGTTVDGLTVVAEAIYRRLTTPRGTLRGGERELDYGLDMKNLIGSSITTGTTAALPARIENEIRKDERIESVTADVASVVDGPATTWTIRIFATTATGTFNLVMGVDDVSAQLLGITTETT